MKFKYLGVLVISVSPALAMGEMGHENNVTLGIGTIMGDLELFGEDPSSALAFGGAIKYFLNDDLYAVGSAANQRIQYDYDSTDETLRSSITNFGGGVGYETPVSDTSALFVQGQLSIGGGSVDYDSPTQSESFDVDSNAFSLGFGLRGVTDSAQWLLGASYQSTTIAFDDRLALEDEDSTDVTFNSSAYFLISEEVFVGPAIVTDFDISVVTANLRFKL